MIRFFPYPALTASLILMWMLLAGFTPGQFILGLGVAMIAAQGLAALGESSPRINRWSAIPTLLGIVLFDVLRSNIAVATLLVKDRRRPRQSGFIVVPIRLRDPTALAVLAIILTSTPGSAWLDFDASRGELVIHVFDLVDEQVWLDLIANRYEGLLMEIFE